jgi:phage/plasmid primase-like uncharacterized protein
MTNSYVKTKDIKEAVRGREQEILNAVGINSNGGRKHINCPYPGHEDKDPSWRWDTGKARAICTCGSDSILDVVIKTTGMTLEETKIFVAEKLGHSDLIIKKRGAKDQYQKTTPESLLNPPQDRRDDLLPAKYLASRLSISVENVPMPTTPVSGHVALEYWAPSTTKTGQHKLVCRAPCAIFGTVDAEGKEHAFRIYLSENGTDKATLGERHNPKKSAKTQKGDNTAGRSVIWGNPKLVDTLILCEGIETGAAIAHAFKDEISSDKMAVASAISTSGVKAFNPWPNTDKVIVAADRDENGEDGGSGAGEKAARTFALRNDQSVEVSIALPGNDQEKVDFLDILLRAGPDAVREQIMNSEAFIPTPEELETERSQINFAEEIRKIEASYPLPHLDSFQLKYAATSTGQIKIHKMSGDKPVPVATPMGVTALLRYPDKADAYGLRVVVQDMAGNQRPLDVERGLLAKGGAVDAKAMLYDAGLRTEGDGERVAVAILKAADPKAEILSVSRPGWHKIEGFDAPVFASPAGDVLGAPNDVKIELSINARLSEPVVAGTSELWKEASNAAMSVENCPHWTIGIIAGFTGVISSLAGFDTFGVNLSGLSSSGKSTAQRLAASVWSTPSVGAGLLQSMRTTENALESLAQNSSGTILILDEMAHAEARVVGRMIYSIAGGIGKSRMRADATLKEQYRWSTFALLSGESSLEEKIRGDGEHWHAGMAVRIPDIDVTGVNRAVDQETLDQIDSISSNYGHAGSAFVQALIADEAHLKPDEIRDRIMRAARKIAGPGADSARIRAATVFGLLLVSGELAQRYGVIPKRPDIFVSVMWAWEKFEQSSDAMALDPASQAIAFLQTWVSERWGVTVRDVNPNIDYSGNERITNRDAVAWYDGNIIYIPTSRIREATGETLKKQHIAKILDEAGLIAKRGADNRIVVRYVPVIGHVDCYAIDREKLGVRPSCTETYGDVM